MLVFLTTDTHETLKVELGIATTRNTELEERVGSLSSQTREFERRIVFRDELTLSTEKEIKEYKKDIHQCKEELAEAKAQAFKLKLREEILEVGKRRFLVSSNF